MPLTRLFLYAFAALMAVTLGGCQGGTASADDGRYEVAAEAYPAKLSLSVRKRLERYRDEDSPLAFLIAPDGGFSVYWRCNGANCWRSDETYIEAAQEYCRTFGHLGDCLVHSVRGRKVWRGPEVYETGVRSRLTTPWRFSNQGPQQARGMVLYVPGYGGHRFPPSLDHERAPAYLRDLNRSGYDVLRLNVAHYDMGIDNEADINQRITETVAGLREQGYSRVYVAGQSRGAWQIMGALKSGLSVDGAILMVPAAHGRATTWEGEVNERYPSGTEDFAALIEGLPPTRMLFGFFAGDEYDTGGRQLSLQRSLGPGLGDAVQIIDRPDQFAGHGAAGHTAFAHVYGECMAQFLSGMALELSACTRPLDPENELHAALRQHLQDRGATRRTGDDLVAHVAARAFHPVRGNPGWWGMLVRPDGSMLQWFPGTYLSGNTLESTWETDDTHFCILESRRHNRKRYCYEVWAMPSGNTGFVSPDGLAFVVGSRPAGRVADLDFTPGNWKGTEG